MAAPTATTTLSLLPSFSFTSSSFSPPSSQSHSASTSFPRSPFFAGGTHLWCRKGFTSAYLTSLSPSNFKFKFKTSWNHFGPAIKASVDYYATLGVPKSANSKQIKAAYRNLARQYHPDVNKEPGATKKFKQISAAYEVLSDDNKKALYDQYSETGVKSTVGRQSGVWELLYICYILCLFFFVFISFGVLVFN